MRERVCRTSGDQLVTLACLNLGPLHVADAEGNREEDARNASSPRPCPDSTDGRSNNVDLPEAKRQIAALKSIVHTMLPAVYPTDSGHSGNAFFQELLADDEAVAIAIANVLTVEEIEQAFEWAGGTRGGVDDELRAMPVVAYLSPEQVERVRVMLLAEDAADEAIEAAMGAPEPLGLEARIGIGQGSFLAALALSAASQPGCELDEEPGRSVGDRLRSLPEPWRRHGRKGLERVKRDVTLAVRKGRDGDIAAP